MSQPGKGPELIASARVLDVPIDKLKLDVENVRFKHIVGKLDQRRIEQLIQEDSETRELCDQILAAKCVYEPLVIGSDFVVIEGNRRLVCLRMLKKQSEEGQLDGIAPSTFSKVKCRMIPAEVEEKDLDLYLATIHVRAKLPWKLFNRAKFIYRLSTVHKMSYDSLAEYLGMSKVTIQRSVRVYKTLLGYQRKFPDDKEWYHKFTYYDELFKRRELKEIREDEHFLADFDQWVNQGKFHDVRDVRKLLKVINDKEALHVLQKENFQAALRVLEANDPTLSNQSFKKIRETISILRNLPRTEFTDLISNPAKYNLIIELEAEAKKLTVQLDAIREASKKLVTR